MNGIWSTERRGLRVEEVVEEELKKDWARLARASHAKLRSWTSFYRYWGAFGDLYMAGGTDTHTTPYYYNLKVFYSLMCLVLFPLWLPSGDVSLMRTEILPVIFIVVCPVLAQSGPSELPERPGGGTVWHGSPPCEPNGTPLCISSLITLSHLIPIICLCRW